MRPLIRKPKESTSNIIAALELFKKDELGVFQVMFQGLANPWVPSVLRSVTDSKGGSFFSNAPEMTKLAQEKVGHPICAVTIRTLVQVTDFERMDNLVEAMNTAVVSSSSSRYNNLIPLSHDTKRYTYKEHAKDVITRQSRRYGMLLNSLEINNLIAFPTATRGKLTDSRRNTVPVPSSMGKGILVGENSHLGQDNEVRLSSSQRLRHTHIIGATGTGKSTLLLNMMQQDIIKGKGFTLLDPHGDVADTIIKYIPKDRIKDVILIDPSDTDFPIGLNILSAKTEVEKIVLSADLVGMFRRLSTSWGDSMDSILANAINAFLEHPEGGTILDLRIFLTNPAFRKKYISKIQDKYVRHFWENEFPILRKNAAAPLLTRLDIFLRPKIIRGMMGQKGGLDFADILNSNKILIVKLAQGLIGEANSYLLGTLITSKLYQAAQGRQEMSQSKRKPYFIYIDEFQNFITPSMESILSGARKFGLGLVLAHQDLQQLFKADARIGNSIISNAGTRICFRVGELDGQKLEKGFHHFEAMDLMNLGVGEAIIRVDRADHDCNLSTYPIPDIPKGFKKVRKKIVEYTRGKYSNPLDESDDDIIEVEEVIEKTKTPIEKEIVKEVEVPTIIEKTDTPITPLELENPVTNIQSEAEEFKKQNRKRATEREHIRLQEFVRKMAEDYNFKAVIEEPTKKPVGRVDVAIHTQKVSLACEISVTTPPSYELKNIQKCLSNGFDIVFMCSNDEKHLEKIKTLSQKKLDDTSLSKVIFGSSQMLVSLLHELSLQYKPKKNTHKGYRVNVNYEPVSLNDDEARLKGIIRAVFDGKK